MENQPTCQEYDILSGRLEADLRVYTEWTWRLEIAKPEEFEYTYQKAKDARNDFLKARKRLDAHVAEHRCEQLNVLDDLKRSGLRLAALNHRPCAPRPMQSGPWSSDCGPLKPNRLASKQWSTLAMQP